VPCIIASPFTKGHPTRPRVYGTPQNQQVPFDHTSVLKLIEWRFGLAPLTARDATPAAHGGVGNVLDVFDFEKPDATVPADIPFPAPPPPDPCGANNPFPQVSGPDDTWGALRRSGLLAGWDVA
jgi:phospholipase C